ncbi:MAG: family 20 glycosylhydrolase [Oscillospiraceae bacterium]|nr:family 20 glycosylhydrolase [Oscillospiraceae bacterium]
MNVISKIKPVPQKAVSGDGRAVLARLGEADFKIIEKGITGELATLAVTRLYDELSGICDAPARESDGALDIVIELSDEAPAEVLKNRDQSYRIEIKQDKIVLTGFGEAGLNFAVTTLLQCIEVENNTVYVPEISVLDWPDLKTRGHFAECRFGSNLMTLRDWTEVIDDIVSKKMNQLVIGIYGCWSVQYDGVISEYVYVPIPAYPLLKTNVIKHYYSPKKNRWIREIVDVPMASEDFFGEVVKYGKKWGVEVVPLWNSYGHNSLIPRKYPEVAPIVNGEPGKNSLCISNPKTYEMLFNIYDHIIDTYLLPNGIKSFHLGMDEVRDEKALDKDDMFKTFSPWCECEKCSKLSSEQQFIQHTVKLISHLKSRGMENVYVYCDAVERYIKNREDYVNALRENDLLDVTVIDWWTYRNKKEELRFKTIYPEYGMRSIVKPHNSYFHWNNSRDTVGNVYYLAEMAHNENAEGLVSYSGWDRTNDKNHMSMADYSWNFEGTGSMEEFNDRYTFREFGARYEEARRAIALMDRITEEQPTEPQNENDIQGNGYMLQRSFAYYFFTYVAKDRDMPRNYPGEAMETLLSDRKLYLHHFNEIVAFADEAIPIFESLAEDTRCNTYLAKRFGCEMKNYRAIARDFLALLEIHDILEKSERDKTVSQAIADIAKTRKSERLSLMLEMESFKEEYLIPSHLRNQSIYMQIFSDIEAYVHETEPENLSLNVCDLREIGSRAFYKLR